jgi:disulfide bond formation protein DsbB
MRSSAVAAFDPFKSPAYRAGSAALVGAIVVILVALGFQHIGGYQPCPLCLQQRWAYYAAIPALFVGLSLLGAERPGAAGVIFLLVSLAFLANAALGVYHAGAEWKFWPGPDTCAAGTMPLGTPAGSLLKQLETARVVRCDEAAWRFLGLSFAGWNVVTSLLLWITSQQAAFATNDQRRGV